jgi:predicted metal-dependent hydrolase
LSSFNDIWSRVLDEACLEFLQEIPREGANKLASHVQVRQNLRALENMSEEWGSVETAALKVFES